MKCPVCLSETHQTDYRPGRGLDPRLREYQCANPTCRKKFFKIQTHQDPIPPKRFPRTH